MAEVAREIMVADTKEVPAVSFPLLMGQSGRPADAVCQTVRLLITDACELSSAEYDQVAKDYHRDLFEKNAPAVSSPAYCTMRAPTRVVLSPLTHYSCLRLSRRRTSGRRSCNFRSLAE